MTDLLLASVAAIALLTMARKGFFRKFPLPSKWLAIGLGAILATRVAGWFVLTYLSRTVTIGEFAAYHWIVSLILTIATACAIACFVIGAFSSRRSPTFGETA